MQSDLQLTAIVAAVAVAEVAAGSNNYSYNYKQIKEIQTLDQFNEIEMSLNHCLNIDIKHESDCA